MRRIILPFLLLLTLVALVFPNPGSAQSPTPTPTFAPSPTPIRPDSALNSYQLKPASVQGMKSIADALTLERFYGKKENQPAWLAAHLYSVKDYDFALITALQEADLRFGDSPDTAGLLNQLATLRMNRRSAMTYSTAGLPFEPLQTMLENALNSGAADPMKIKDWLATNGINLEVSLVQPVDNLFGDKAHDTLYLIGGDSYGWLFTLRGAKPGSYKIVSVSEDWINLWKNTWKIDMLDLTGDSVPELALQRIYDSGENGAVNCWEKLMVFSWTANGFRHISAGVGDFGETSKSFACLGYKIDTSQASGAVIEAQTGGPVGCSDPDHAYDFARLTSYQWNKTFFERTGERVQPLTKKDNAACAAMWAYEAGPDDPAALPLIENALQAWPAEINQKFGPAAQDYFRFKLGTWYAYLGQRDAALKNLAQVRDRPANPTFKTLPAIAKQFMNEYQALNAFAACQSVLSSLKSDISGFSAAGAAPYDASRIVSSWGFADPAWARTGDPTTSLDGRSEETALCNPVYAFRAVVRKSGAQTATQLSGFLYKSEVQWTGMREGDVDADGANDFLVLAHTQAAAKYLDLWAILKRDNELAAVLIEPRFSRTVNSTFAWRAFQPSAAAGMVNAYLARDKLTLFRITTQSETPQLIQLPVQDVETSRDFEPTSAFDVRRGNGPYPSFNLVAQRTSGQTSVYTWDDATMQFVINTSPSSQDDRLRAAGDALFGEKSEPLRARVLIQELLRNRINEPVPSKRSTDKFAPRVRPYLQYLLGLTYELTNQPADAARAYYQLWRDYPENPYAIIARMKLDIKH